MKHSFGTEKGGWWYCSFCGEGAGGPNEMKECPKRKPTGSIKIGKLELGNIIKDLEQEIGDVANDMGQDYSMFSVRIDNAVRRILQNAEEL